MATNVHLFPTTILLFTAVAVAQNTPPASVDTSPAVDSPRAYLRAAGGLSVLPSTSLDSADAGALQQANASFDTGYAYTFGGGYRITNDWAVEAEIGYRTNSIDRVRNAGPAITDGDFASLGFFVNGIYRLPVEGRLRPYVGLGAGYLEEIDIDLGSGANVDYSDSAFAVQAIVGVEYQLASRWALQLEGRYLQAFGQDLAAESGTGIRYEADYQPITLMVGLSWSF
jgi:opacity protein-like surface antigen